MKLIDYFNVIIPEIKITGYLLSSTHTVGKHKAKYFSLYGFSVKNANLFSKNILKMVKDYNVSDIIQNSYGTSYIIEGKLDTPSRKKIWVRSVWIVLKNERKATLVTIYPLK